jgi:flavin-binding protein dodecin
VGPRPDAYTGSREAPVENLRDVGKGVVMSDSVYRVTEVIGTSEESWEAATRNAVETAARTVRDLRVAEVVRLDVTIDDGKVTTFRARLNISFKYESTP